MLETFKNRNQMKKKCQVKRIPNGEIITWKISLKIHQGMRYPLIPNKIKMSNSQKREWFQTNQVLYKVSWCHKVPKETICIPPTHTWKGSQGECSKKNRIAPQALCIMENLHLNTKSTRWDHHFHYIYTNNRQSQGNNKIHKWYGIQWELTQS